MRDVVRVWELGQGQAAWYRAWLMLAPAFPETPQHELTGLSIGRRDAYLFRLRERILGPLMQAFAKCPQCREPIEFTLDSRVICRVDPERANQTEHTTAIDGIEIRFRLLTSRDWAAITEFDAGAADAIRLQLAARSILWARQGGRELSLEELSDQALAVLSERIADCDAPADLRIGLACPACSTQWFAPFDIVSFLWNEMSNIAKRLLDEVHTLAREYGWSESAIFAMPAVRRQHYLKMLA